MEKTPSSEKGGRQAHATSVRQIGYLQAKFGLCHPSTTCNCFHRAGNLVPEGSQLLALVLLVVPSQVLRQLIDVGVVIVQCVILDSWEQQAVVQLPPGRFRPP